MGILLVGVSESSTRLQMDTARACNTLLILKSRNGVLHTKRGPVSLEDSTLSSSNTGEKVSVKPAEVVVCVICEATSVSVSPSSSSTTVNIFDLSPLRHGMKSLALRLTT